MGGSADQRGQQTGPRARLTGMTQHAVHLTAAVTHEGDWYVARCLQVEVTSQGTTIEESLGNLREALELYFEDEPVPEVYEVITAPIEIRVA
jgi:predicted RNase H-like HicB family nuclease